MSRSSKTDWKRLEQAKEDEIDTSDIPELDDEFFRNEEIRIRPGSR